MQEKYRGKTVSGAIFWHYVFHIRRLFGPKNRVSEQPRGLACPSTVEDGPEVNTPLRLDSS